eukprot:TRINITY_DN18758_c0_g2_i10.p1 TRINITY_DN18758_c0_g2~~TRINITY_DN18758_c0_g2_i10.p1  ORF type:complete len:502 (-),score=214.35 TRINITY_DN18758_c0_g2_i10:71-1576(-)
MCIRDSLLLETAAGFGLFKVLKDGKVQEGADLSKDFGTSEGAAEMVKLQKFSKFADQTDALAAATAMVEGKLDKSLKKFLKKNIVDKELADELIVSDSKLAGLVKEKLDIQCLCDAPSLEVLRGVRLNMDSLIPSISTAAMKQMQIGLSHSLSRHKLKFSPDKVDTMVVQAIGLLDDLDKEVNTYSMRIKEWYGWHFPEMQKIVVDNTMYAKTVVALGMIKGAKDADLSDILPEEVEAELKAAAQLSMGTEISQEDLDNIHALCDQTLKLTEYRTELYDYLKNRMAAIAPNLTVLVGELVGARLISHAGSLMALAKQPASTVQILGAEKALFRALKTKKDTPKYGLIYHASLIGQAQPKFKGKISRVLAAKCALSIRLDALGETSTATIGIEDRVKVEERLRQLEGRTSLKANKDAKALNGPTKYHEGEGGAAYNTAGDSTLKSKKRKAEEEVEEEADDSEEEVKEKKEKKEKKKKKKAKVEIEDESEEEQPKKKKKKKDK